MRVWMFAAVVLLVGCDAASKGGAGSGGGTSPSGSSVANAPANGSAKPIKAGGPLLETTTANVIAHHEVKLEPKNYDGLQTLIASKKGKVVVVDVWSTYCDPCMKEFPGLVGLHKKYGPEKVACISMCTNYSGIGKPEDELAEPLKFLEKQGATFDNLLSTDADEALYKKLKIGSVPCIFVYDADGKLAKLFDKETTYAEVEKVVTPLVK
jgi:thiol-disulfide isomerase/thioredoxin